MRHLSDRLGVAANDQRGMTLVEVMVAMFVFATISTLVLSSLVQILSVNRASAMQHVAANLAAQELERARATTDLFALTSEERSVTVNGTTFAIDRDAVWVSENDDEAACGTGGGNLRFKRVSVSISWSGMSPSQAPVRADTIIDPSQRLNDPSTGTVLVSVIDAEGFGVANATVSLTATANGAPRAPVQTDAEGCAYLLEVARGAYTVSVSKLNYVGLALDPTPKQADIAVEAGSTSSLGFQYDEAATITARLAAGSAVRLPTNLPLTFVSTYGVVTQAVTTTSTSTVTQRTVKVHPRVNYRIFAGNYGRNTGAECTAPDPNAWPAATLGGVAYAAGAAPEVNLPKRGSLTVDVPMGTVSVRGQVRGLRATAAPGAPGDPTCASTIVHEFGDVSANSTVVIALPFGTWALTDRNGVAVSAVTVSGNDTAVANVVTLDPRELAP